MKNQLAFIPENISSISHISLHKKTANQQQIQYSLTDSTDNLIEQILKQRAERIQKQQEKDQTTFPYKTPKKKHQEMKQIKQIPIISENKYRQSNRTSRQKNSIHGVIPELNESLASKQQVNSKISSKTNKDHFDDTHKQSKQNQENRNQNFQDRLQQLQNQTSQLIKVQVRKNDEKSKQYLQQNQSKLRKIQKNKSYSVDYIDNLEEQFKNPKKKSQNEYKISEKSARFNDEKRNLNQNKSNKSNKNKSEKQFNDLYQQKISKLQSLLFDQQKNDKSNFKIQQSQKKQQNQKVNSIFKKKNQQHQYPSKINHQVKNQLVQSFKKNNELTFQKKSSQPRLQDNIKVTQNGQIQDNKLANKRQSQSKNVHFSDYIQQIDINFNGQSAYSNDNKQRNIQEYETDYSRVSRSDKILSHEYQSNINKLIHQTKELLQYYQMNILDEQKKQIRKKIMQAQIYNNRLKMYLRTGSYSKKFNYIAPIPKNNDHPLQFKSKFTLNNELKHRLDELTDQIQEQKKKQAQLQLRLNILTKYYNYMKEKKIIDNQEITMIYQYNSQLQMYLSQLDQFITGGNSQISTSQVNGKDSLASSKRGFKFNAKNTTQKTLEKTKSPLKKLQVIRQKKINIMAPLYQYNLLRIKSQISKQIMGEFEIYNMGRIKRIKDENKLMKKELQFIDLQIEHFDKSFAAELKNYEEMAKPKITYQTFQMLEPQTPYSKSPFNRDFHGNNKGQNNINIYRVDYNKRSPSSKNNLSQKNLQKSKYTIKRSNHPSNIPKSSNQISLGHNLSFTSLEQKSNTQVSFFRRSNMNQYITPKKSIASSKSQNKLSLIRQIPNKKVTASDQKLNLSRSSKSIGSHSKRLLRFHNNEANQDNNKKGNKPDKSNHVNYLTSKKNVQSEYYISSSNFSQDR